jgi:hypothetical protein
MGMPQDERLDEGNILTRALRLVNGLEVYPKSPAQDGEEVFFLGRAGGVKLLGVLCEGEPAGAFHGSVQEIIVDGRRRRLLVGPADGENAAALRRRLDFLLPKLVGLVKSAGCGDRLGLATPGHVRALRKVLQAHPGARLTPVLAQQSIRENTRTGRSPQQVMDEAMWGVFQEGWRDGFGSDADHLKTLDDVDVCAAAGFTMFTVDPGAYVDARADVAGEGELEEALARLPWSELESDPSDTLARFSNVRFDLDGRGLRMTREEAVRSAVKYGRVVAHTRRMYRRLEEAMRSRPFELEMSVDETDTVTSLPEHVYIAVELARVGVRWVSLAPRYVGRFEKGVDYLGEPGQSREEALALFERLFADHLAAARALGPYKLSLHSGSDKFSVYPICARLAGDLLHLKTAGTSYLEALRTIAHADPKLFRRILRFAVGRYETDRVSYHVSASVSQVPAAETLTDEQLPALLDDFAGREVLHVTFGAVLNDQNLRGPFFDTLRRQEEAYYSMLERHFEKHLAPLVRRY